jgi:hypothetical protein
MELEKSGDDEYSIESFELNETVNKVNGLMLGSLISGVLVVICMVVVPVYAQEQIFDAYVDPEGLFTVEYPSDWELIAQTADEYVAYMSFNLRDKVTDELMYASISVLVKEEPEELETIFCFILTPYFLRQRIRIFYFGWNFIEYISQDKSVGFESIKGIRKNRWCYMS